MTHKVFTIERAVVYMATHENEHRRKNNASGKEITCCLDLETSGILRILGESRTNITKKEMITGMKIRGTIEALMDEKIIKGAKAARILGVSRQRLNYRLKKGSILRFGECLKILNADGMQVKAVKKKDVDSVLLNAEGINATADDAERIMKILGYDVEIV